MFKRFFTTDDQGVSFLASANLLASTIQQFLSSIEPILHTMLVAGQVLVAGATVYYILRKAKAVRVTPSRKRKVKK